MEHNKIVYQIDGVNYVGYLALPKTNYSEIQQHPAIIVAHAWMGQDHFARKQAEKLAQLGYVGFAADVYGEGKVVSKTEDAQNLMLPLFKDRQLLQKRIIAAFEVLQRHRLVDRQKIGAIGFCFGGLTVIELLRSGVDVKGVVSLHGVLGNQMGPVKAKTVPIAKSVKGSLLVLHGNDDPLVSQEDILEFKKEFTDAKVDWQMNIYSHTSHAFTNPDMHDEIHGLKYQPLTTERAWWALLHFFSERFGLEKQSQLY